MLSAYLGNLAASSRFLENPYYLIIRKSLSHLVLLLKRTIHHPVAISGGQGRAHERRSDEATKERRQLTPEQKVKRVKEALTTDRLTPVNFFHA